MNEIKFRFFVDKDCNWFQDSKPITHKRIYNFNYQNLKRDEQGLFYVEENNSRAYVNFEDKPYIVKSIDISEDNRILLNLNDFSCESLNIDTLIFKENIPYCSVKNGKYEAKFSRPALHQIAKAITSKNGSYYINSRIIKYP
ncbi:DUF1285 domain-containing protein [bacterium]|nr:DUF1285 domain-containing protein [bacterium]